MEMITKTDTGLLFCFLILFIGLLEALVEVCPHCR